MFQGDTLLSKLTGMETRESYRLSVTLVEYKARDISIIFPFQTTAIFRIKKFPVFRHAMFIFNRP